MRLQLGTEADGCHGALTPIGSPEGRAPDVVVGGGPAAGRFRVLDYSFTVQTPTPELAALIEETLAPFAAEDPVEGPLLRIVDDHQPWSPYALLLDGEPLREHVDPRQVLDYFFWYVNRAAIESVTGCLALHAAAAAWAGEGVLLPAKMDSGKTTLVAGLTKAGFSYLTDEASLLDSRSGLIRAYPKALWMEEASLRALGGIPDPERRLIGDLYQVPPHDIRPGAILEEAVPVRYIVSPRYMAGASTHLHEIGRAEALVMLHRNAFNFRGRQDLQLLKGIVEGARCFRLTTGGLEPAVRAIANLVRDKGKGSSHSVSLPHPA